MRCYHCKIRPVYFRCQSEDPRPSVSAGPVLIRKSNSWPKLWHAIRLWLHPDKHPKSRSLRRICACQILRSIRSSFPWPRPYKKFHPEMGCAKSPSLAWRPLAWRPTIRGRSDPITKWPGSRRMRFPSSTRAASRPFQTFRIPKSGRRTDAWSAIGVRYVRPGRPLGCRKFYLPEMISPHPPGG